MRKTNLQLENSFIALLPYLFHCFKPQQITRLCYAIRSGKKHGEKYDFEPVSDI